ncbi:hypothetical protein LUZ60_004932 [Juncus effusus]|nr:hypothetical protein LUZ60_004932 [Juncus effusus]
MGMTRDVLRNSINTFFQSYHHFTSIAALLVFPAAILILLSESLAPSSKSILSALSIRLETLFHAAGFPKSYFFSLLNIKLSQTIFSFFFSLPFTLTFLLLAKSCIIQIFRDSPHHGRLISPNFSKYLPLFPNLLSTHLFNTFVILSCNATTFSLLFLLFNAVDISGLKSNASEIFLSTIGAIVYSIVIATTTVVCNLALIISGMENCNGYISILKACILIRGRIGTSLVLALPTNIGMAAFEALFQFRITRQFRVLGKIDPSVMCETFTITYIYSILMVFEIIVSCMFYIKSRFVERSTGEDEVDWREFEPEEKDDFLV